MLLGHINFIQNKSNSSLLSKKPQITLKVELIFLILRISTANNLQRSANFSFETLSDILLAKKFLDKSQTRSLQNVSIRNSSGMFFEV